MNINSIFFSKISFDHKARYCWLFLICTALTLMLLASRAYAQTLPGSAEVERIIPKPERLVPPRKSQTITIPEHPTAVKSPESAKTIKFTLKKIVVQDVTVFTVPELEKLYASYIGQEIALDTVWNIADTITAHYRKEQYFLSRAYVPEQEIENGVVVIKVVEGYVDKVVLGDAIPEQELVEDMVADLTSKKPLKVGEIESFLLRLEDLPGASFFGTLQPEDSGEEGAVMLILKRSEEKGQGMVQLDNYGSRFLGPYQGLLMYQDSLIPFNQSKIFLLSSLLPDEVGYAAFEHEVTLSPLWKFQFQGSYAHATPGSTLENLEITSASTSFGAGLLFQPIRQYRENLQFSFTLDGRNTNGDILGNIPLTHERIRAFRVGVNYDTADSWGGYNDIRLMVSQGLDIAGSSKAGETMLSRAEAKPDFTVANLRASHEHPILTHLTIVGQVAGQIASKPLYSAEEFGYGGQEFGRAYDPSELTGDHGLAGSLELHYYGLEPWYKNQIVPYLFYDIGKVWNNDQGGEDSSAASGGIGVRFINQERINANIAIAQPFTRDISRPIYGHARDPRILFQISYIFQ
ncbi:MAG: ShlB/FhaC/HecB family hemolysin secretion/activation protein [Rickettsiales bacterium]|jgi:hemolysin activation/secretion protein|nr:ShlB/FhaC/HecB family hemolysin secretion/activation protein [Rickettsiales bacterium]